MRCRVWNHHHNHIVCRDNCVAGHNAKRRRAIDNTVIVVTLNSLKGICQHRKRSIKLGHLNFRIGYQRVAGNDVAMLIVLDAIGGGVLEGCKQIIDGYRILDLRTSLTGCIGLLVEIDKQCAVTFGIQAFRQCH